MMRLNPIGEIGSKGPMSIRTKNKLKRRREILEAATLLIEQHGYQKTTIDAIAETAEVGVATVYNYFRNKEGIVKELLVPEIQHIFDQGRSIINNPSDDPVEATLSLLRLFYRLGNNWQHKKLLRLVSLTGVQGYPAFDEITEWADLTADKLIKDLLGELQGRGDIKPQANVRDIATIVYSVFNQHYFDCITHDQVSPEQTFLEIERLIPVILEPWRS